MAKIFISYSSTDRNTVDLWEPQIRNIYGYGSYWYDTAISGGIGWWEKIESEIQSCQVFLFLMSDASVVSNACLDELRKALLHRKQILQILLPTLTLDYQNCLPDDLQTQLKALQYVDLRREFDRTQNRYLDLSRLWGALNNLLSNIRLPLSTTERWLLHNQFEILKQINPDNPNYQEDYFDNALEILAQGYEWYYNEIALHIDTHIFPYSRALEVIDILNMFEDLQYAYEKLEDKTGIDKSELEFFGFSGNNETAEMQFTRFMMEKMKQLDYLKPIHGFNSHIPMLDAYRRMLKVWNVTPDKHNLSKDEIIRIVEASKPN